VALPWSYAKPCAFVNASSARQPRVLGFDGVATSTTAITLLCSAETITRSRAAS